jgi:aminobenzoyl-glutamate utilization protein A
MPLTHTTPRASGPRGPLGVFLSLLALCGLGACSEAGLDPVEPVTYEALEKTVADLIREHVERVRKAPADAEAHGHLALAYEGRPLRSGELGAGCVDFLDSRRFDVTYTGKAAHPCGDPQNGRNALLAACAACLDIFAIPPHSEGLSRVNVGTLSAGVSRNTIAPNAYFELEVRGENEAITDYGEERVLKILEGTAAAHGVKCEVVPAGNTPSGSSDVASIEVVRSAAGKVDWFENVYDYAQVGGSDDATEMMNRVQQKGGKATYMGIGADLAGGLHAGNFDFDENAMAATVELLLAVVDEVARR